MGCGCECGCEYGEHNVQVFPSLYVHIDMQLEEIFYVAYNEVSIIIQSQLLKYERFSFYQCLCLKGRWGQWDGLINEQALIGTSLEKAGRVLHCDIIKLNSEPFLAS